MARKLTRVPHAQSLGRSQGCAADPLARPDRLARGFSLEWTQDEGWWIRGVGGVMERVESYDMALR